MNILDVSKYILQKWENILNIANKVDISYHILQLVNPTPEGVRILWVGGGGLLKPP